MRGLLTLQICLGLFALFGVAYLSAGTLMAPVETAQLVRAADAEAKLGALGAASVWDARREALRSVVTTMADTPAVRSFGADFSRSQRDRGLNRALEAVVMMSGVQGQVALLDSSGDTVVDDRDARVLASTQAAKVALRGQSVVVVEALADEFAMIAASPVRKKDQGKVAGALVLSVPLRADHQAPLLSDLPPGVSIAVQLDDKPVFGTLPVDAMKEVVNMQVGGTINVLGQTYRAERRALTHDGSSTASVMALAALRTPATASVSGHTRMLLLVLGVFAALLAALAVGLSEVMPGSAPAAAPRAVAKKPPATATPRPAQSADIPWDPPAATPTSDASSKAATPSLKLDFGLAAVPEAASEPPVISDGIAEPQVGVEARAAPPEPSEPPEPLEPMTDGLTLGEAAYGLADEGLVQQPSSSVPAAALEGVTTDLSSSVLDAKSPFNGLGDLQGDGLNALSASPAALDAALSGYAGDPDAVEPVPLPSSAGDADWPADAPMFNQETLPAHPAPGEEPGPNEQDHFALDEQFSADAPLPPQMAAPPAGSPSPFAPPEPGGNFREPTPFDKIADAAFAAPPPEPVPDQRTDLPIPKGPMPPEIKAAQRADAQRRALDSSAPAPVPAPGGHPYDPNLPIPKDLPLPTGLPPPTRRGQSELTADVPEVSGTATVRPTPLPTSPESDQRDPWRNPSVPKMKAVQPPPTGSLPPTPMDGPSPFDESHYRSVYQQFIASKAKLGESVENLSYDGFRTKLRNSEESLLDRHGCRAVRFQVLVKDRTVSLRPQLVR